MSEEYSIENDPYLNEESDADQALRPKQFSDFEGQEKTVDNLKVFIENEVPKREIAKAVSNITSYSANDIYDRIKDL